MCADSVESVSAQGQKTRYSSPNTFVSAPDSFTPMTKFVRVLMSRFGAAGTSLLITLFSIVSAVLITLIIYSLVESPDLPLVTANRIAIPAVASLLIAPPASYFVLQLLQSLIDAENQNRQLISELSIALADVKRLSGLLPVCAHCKNIRDDSGAWHQIELYVAQFSEAEFSHDICPDCLARHFPNIN